MKLSNALKDNLLSKILTNFKGSPPAVAQGYGGYRIRFFDSSLIGVQNPLAAPEFTSTYFQANNPAGLLLDFGFSVAIPHNSFVVSGRSIKLLGTYTEAAKISGTADLACIFACYINGSSANQNMNNFSSVHRVLLTDSVVLNGMQGAFVLTQTTMAAGDSVSIADFTLNLIEP